MRTRFRRSGGIKFLVNAFGWWQWQGPKDPKEESPSSPPSLIPQTNLKEIHTKRMSREMDSRFLVLILSVSWPSCKRLTEATCNGRVCKESRFLWRSELGSLRLHAVKEKSRRKVKKCWDVPGCLGWKSGKSSRFQRCTLPVNQPVQTTGGCQGCWGRGYRGKERT